SGGTTVLADLRGQLFQHSLTLPLALAALLVVGALTARLALAPWAGPLATGTAGIVLLKMPATTSALSPSWALYVPAVAAVGMVGGGLAAFAARRPGPSLVGAGMVQLGWFLASLAVPDRFGIAAGLFLLSAYLLAAAGGPIALAALPHGLAGGGPGQRLWVPGPAGQLPGAARGGRDRAPLTDEVTCRAELAFQQGSLETFPHPYQAPRFSLPDGFPAVAGRPPFCGCRPRH